MTPSCDLLTPSCNFVPTYFTPSYNRLINPCNAHHFRVGEERVIDKLRHRVARVFEAKTVEIEFGDCW